jgi:hypothetical protein
MTLWTIALWYRRSRDAAHAKAEETNRQADRGCLSNSFGRFYYFAPKSGAESPIWGETLIDLLVDQPWNE